MMRVVAFFFVALLWSATASAQSVSIEGCAVDYHDILNILKDNIFTPNAKTEGRIIGYRRTDGLPVEVRCPEAQLMAQEIDWDQEAKTLTLRGQVVFQQGGTRIAAVRGEFNRKTQLGRFETASGTLQLTDRATDRTLFGALEPEAYFTAALIEKIGEKTYRLTDATFTTCVQPSRRWEMMMSRLTFTVDRHATMRNARLLVKDVSVMYLPYFRYPIQEDNRATGFLMPGYGSSTYRGFTLSNAFFWAMKRNMDLTLYHDWFTKSGHGLGADYRYVGIGGAANVQFQVVNEKSAFGNDGTQPTSSKRSYRFQGGLNQSLPGRIRVQGRANFFTDVTTQQLYQSDINAFTQRTSSFGLNATGSWGRINASAQADRNDVYYGTAASSYRTFPRINVTASDAPMTPLKIYIGGSVEAVNFARFDDVDDPDTRSTMFRTDGRVSMRRTLSMGPALTLTPSVSARRTEWNARQDPETRERIEAPITRELFEAQLVMSGPVFSRVFNTEGNRWVERFKHVIEPSVSVKRVSAFDAFDEVIPFDPGVDTIVGGVTQVSYGIRNTLHARVRQVDGESVARPVAALDLRQSYYSDERAAQYDGLSSTSFGPQYSLLPPPSKFSPWRLALNLWPTTTISADFGLEYDTQFKAVRSYSASARITQAVLDFSGTWNKQQVIAGLPNYSDPRYANHSLSLSGRLKKPGGGASLTYSTAIDILNSRFLQHRFGAFYNAQCCGIAMDYVVANYSHLGFRNDKRFSLSFSLAGIGTFVNPFGVFGNNGRQ
jgi:LPS-assembly protein